MRAPKLTSELVNSPCMSTGACRSNLAAPEISSNFIILTTSSRNVFLSERCPLSLDNHQSGHHALNSQNPQDSSLGVDSGG